MAFSDDQKLQVQQATDIVRLVGEHVALRPRGKEFVGLCPFHDDKNPSMYVSPSKQIYKCFSCGAGGDVFTFAVNYHKMTFPEAVRHLAERAGIKLVETGKPRDEAQGPSDRQLLLEANARAMSFFQALYRHAEHGKVAREYVAQRGIHPGMVEAFAIGYAADRWDGLVETARKNNWNLRSLEMAGLVMARKGDAGVGYRVSGVGKNEDTSETPSSATPDTRSPTPGFYDRMRHRLIFPIHDALGRVIAFGGRKMRAEDEPKYLNTQESAVFNKSATLYGLHLAKKPIIDSRTAIIVEGYTDVIACHQAGVCNVVATLGTALTSQHVTELRRYCEKVVLIYDADEAGIKAADRAVEVFLTGDLDVAIAVLPDELDPADLFEREDGLERWKQSVGAATDALKYQFQRVSQKLDATDTLTGRQKLIEEYLRKLAQFGLGRRGPQGTGAIRRAMVLQRLSELLHMPERQITDLLLKLAPSNRFAQAPVSQASTTGEEHADQDTNGTELLALPQSGVRLKALQQAERQVIGCLLRNPQTFHQTTIASRPLDEALTPSEMLYRPCGELYDRIYQKLADGAPVRLALFVGELAEEGRQDLIDLATRCDAEVEASCGENPELIANLLVGAVQAIQNYRTEAEYQQKRQDDAGPSAQGPSPPGDAAATPSMDDRLRQVQEYLRANPSPRRLPRVRL